MAPLSGEQKRRLHAMLRQAFDQQDLRELFVFYLNMPLDDVISPNDDARAVALKVITASEREGSLSALLRAVADERPARQDIQALVAELLATLESPVEPSNAPKSEPVSQPDDASRTTHHASRPSSAPVSPDPLLITTPIRMEFVLVDDGRPLCMGTPPGQVQELLKCFDWAKEFDEWGFFRHEQPATLVRVAPFAIGRYPVTNTQYAVFIEESGHPAPSHFGDWGQPPRGEEDHPLVNVSWHDAIAFTQWLSRATGRAIRLPTEVEWEKAARGADGRLWPWGDDWDPTRANTARSGVGGTTAVGAYSPQGDSPCGAADMAGNVSEWCSTKWREDYSMPADDELTGTVARVQRGGAYDFDEDFARCAARFSRDPDFGLGDYGFRVAVSP